MAMNPSRTIKTICHFFIFFFGFGDSGFVMIEGYSSSAFFRVFGYPHDFIDILSPNVAWSFLYCPVSTQTL
jgi:hypothetical protein